jgi:hypothetical protein
VEQQTDHGVDQEPERARAYQHRQQALAGTHVAFRGQVQQLIAAQLLFAIFFLMGWHAQIFPPESLFFCAVSIINMGKIRKVSIYGIPKVWLVLAEKHMKLIKSILCA